jgi:predicted nuclease of predicted toxin-antitoxin system
VKFKTDENLPLEAALILRDADFDCETVWDEALSGASDQTIAERVRQESRVLLTLDLELANLRAYLPNDYVGIIVLRPKIQARTQFSATSEISYRLSASCRYPTSWDKRNWSPFRKPLSPSHFPHAPSTLGRETRFFMI